MNIPFKKTESISKLGVPEKSRLKQILGLSVPIAVAMVGFASIGLIDIAMVGRLGDVALAAVGITNSLFFLLFVIAMGLGIGVQTLTAMRVGEGNLHLAGYDLNAGLVLGVVLGLILTILGYITLPFLISQMNQDPVVVEQGIAYLNTRLPQLLFFTLCFTFRSYWSGIGKPKIILLDMIATIVGNVVFNYLFIFGKFGFPRMGVAGAGLSTTLATLLTLGLYFFIGIKNSRINGFLGGLPDKERIKTLIRISIPVSISRFLVTIGISVLFLMVGFMGTKETAALNVMNNIMVTLTLIADSMGFAAITFVGQALGKKDIKDAKKWGWDIAKVGTSILFIFGVLVILFPQAILSVFIVDPATISIVVDPLRLSGVNVLLIGFVMMMCSALIGAGAAKISLRWTLTIQWCLTLPLQWVLGIYFGYGLMGIVLGFLIAYSIGSVIISFVWHGEGWTRVKV